MDSEALHTTSLKGEQPSQFAERVGIMYAEASAQKDKKTKGQFFTPNAISRFMGGMATPTHKKVISILDPGCGTANLSCALIEFLVEKSSLSDITLTLYETDKKVIPYTVLVLDYLKTWYREKGVQLNNIVKEEDFVLKNYECLNDEISERKAIIRFALDEPQIDGEKIAKAAKYIDECQVMIKMLTEENNFLRTLL